MSPRAFVYFSVWGEPLILFGLWYLLYRWFRPRVQTSTPFLRHYFAITAALPFLGIVNVLFWALDRAYVRQATAN